jgi:Holliday junction resolvasome RuvABC endonuclease subunit
VTDIYIGIDPGVRNLALVAFSPSRNIVSTWQPKGEIPTGVRRLCYLMHHIKQWLGEVSSIGPIKGIAMEGYSMMEKFGQHNSGEVGAAIKLALVTWFGLDNHMAYPTIVAANQLKKFATGSGNAKKSMIPKEIWKRWNTDFNNENLAEAYVLARIAWGMHDGPERTTFQREVCKALSGRTEWNPAWAESATEPEAEPVTEPEAEPPRRHLIRRHPVVSH